MSATEQIVLTVNTTKRTLEYSGTLILGVVGDDCAQRIYFQCPKYVNEFFDDLTSENIKIYIDYKNAYGEPYLQQASTLATIDDSTVMFSWIITNLVTAKAGDVKFNICCKKVVDGVLENEWHTTDNITGKVLTKVDTSKKTPEVITHDSVTVENFTAEYSSFKAQVATLNENLTDAKQYIESEVATEVAEVVPTEVEKAINAALPTPLYSHNGNDIIQMDLAQYDNFILHWVANKSIVVNDGAGNTTIYYGPAKYSEANTFAVIAYGSATGSMQYTLKGTCIYKDDTGIKKFLVELITGDTTVNVSNNINTIPDSSKNRTISVSTNDEGLYFKTTDLPFGVTEMHLVAKSY